MLIFGSDHAGLPLKEILISCADEKDLEYVDLGCAYGETADYPDIAKAVSKRVLENSDNLGILCCGSGIGVSVTANRFKGIRAALCGDCYSAKYAKLHNNANVLCLGARVIGSGLATEIFELFLNTGYEGGRHEARILKIDN